MLAQNPAEATATERPGRAQPWASQRSLCDMEEALHVRNKAGIGRPSRSAMLRAYRV